MHGSSNSILTSSNSEVVKGTEMTLGISNFDTINPIITTNKKVQDITKLIYEPLINITSDYNKEYTLAAECAKVSGTAYVIKLRQGVKWSDGNRFTSNDVKYTIDRLKESNNSVYASNVSSIQEVDIIDNYTLRIILSKEIDNFEYYLNFPILSSNYYLNTDFWNTEKNKAPTTTGRFKISDVTNNTIILEKNANWWNKEDTSVIQKITINLYSTVAELYNAFKMGSIDLISTENTAYEQYIGTIGYDLTQIDGKEYVFLALNTSNHILSDINVRKALRCALDKNRVISNSYGNMYKQSNFPLNPASFLVTKLPDENFYNVDEVGNLLRNSGWEQKNGVWQKVENYKTIRIELNMVVRANDGIRCKAAEDIKNQFAEQGILVNIIYAQDNEYNGYLNNVNYDMMLGKISQPIAPDLTTYFGNNNLAKYNNQEINEIMQYIGNITDENELKQKYQRMYDIYNEEVPYIGIARNTILAVRNTNLVGEVKANWYNMFYNIKEWYITK